MKKVKALLIVVILISSVVFAQDWPIFKGNLYFTGNNDEIIVKNNNLKWLYQASEQVFNPIVSDGLLYFVDRGGFLYCLNEEYGTLVWKISLRNISAQFKKLSRAAGKIKYPLIKGNLLFVSDPVAIYALNKKTGKVLWARTGMRLEEKPNVSLTGYKGLPSVDGIYSDPIIYDDSIFYGTRNMFLARNILNGHEKWENRNIKSYSGFPTFYDEYIFSQSMDYKKNLYTVYCLDSRTGKEIWRKNLQRPMKIFPPVIYKQKVYIPSTTKMYCLDLKTGETQWIKDYKRYITSNPSFTDRAIVFSIDNSHIAVINPENGEIDKVIKVREKSSPRYVTIRDQVYVAYNGPGGVNRAYGYMKAFNFSDNKELWSFRTPFPGGVSQPIASKGIMFLPAGNYMYAIGATGYPRIVKGGSANSDKKNNGEYTPKDVEELKKRIKPEIPQLKTRKMKLGVKNNEGSPVDATVEVKKYDGDKLIYSKRQKIKNGQIEVPEGDDVEVMITAKDHIPKKVIINKNDQKKDVTLDRIKRGESYVVQNLNFEFGKAYLKKGSLNILDDLIVYMKRNKTQKIEVRGFTDNVGKDTYNQKLSERRADSVREYMIKNGISPERIKSTGFGEKKPIASNKTKDGRAKNRRTEFFFLD